MNGRAYLTGFLLGLLVAATVWYLFGRDSDGEPKIDLTSPTRAAAPETYAEAPPALPAAAPATLSGREAPPATFARGRAVLAIGDGFVFGETQARPRARAEDVDLLCLEINRRTSAKLRAPHGGRAASMPVVYDGEKPNAAAAYARVFDAPLELAPATIAMRKLDAAEENAVLLVRGADGRTRKVLLERVEGAENALERRIHLRYEEVPQQEEGGRIDLPGGTHGRRVSKAEAATIDALLQVPSMLRSGWFSNLAYCDWQRVDDLPAETKAGEQVKLVLERMTHDLDLHTLVTGIVVRGGVPADTTLSGNGTTILVIDGHLDGTVDGGGFGFVRVRGDVRGTLKLRGSCPVLVEGDVTGRIESNGIHTILIQGSVTRPQDGLVLMGIDNVYHRGYLDRATIARFTGIKGISKLHVLESDLEAQDEPHRIRPWQEVWVGEEIWQSLPR